MEGHSPTICIGDTTMRLHNRTIAKIKICYQTAKRCRDLALRAGDESQKADYLAMEQRWSNKAREYQLTEAITGFARKTKKHPKHRLEAISSQEREPRSVWQTASGKRKRRHSPIGKR